MNDEWKSEAKWRAFPLSSYVSSRMVLFLVQSQITALTEQTLSQSHFVQGSYNDSSALHTSAVMKTEGSVWR